MESVRELGFWLVLGLLILYILSPLDAMPGVEIDDSIASLVAILLALLKPRE